MNNESLIKDLSFRVHHTMLPVAKRARWPDLSSMQLDKLL